MYCFNYIQLLWGVQEVDLFQFLVDLIQVRFSLVQASKVAVKQKGDLGFQFAEVYPMDIISRSYVDAVRIITCTCVYCQAAGSSGVFTAGTRKTLPDYTNNEEKRG